MAETTKSATGTVSTTESALAEVLAKLLEQNAKALEEGRWRGPKTPEHIEKIAEQYKRNRLPEAPDLKYVYPGRVPEWAAKIVKGRA
jgi:hypothetical protein